MTVQSAAADQSHRFVPGVKGHGCIDRRKCFMQQGQSWLQTDQWRLSHIHHMCIYFPSNNKIWTCIWLPGLSLRRGVPSTPAGTRLTRSPSLHSFSAPAMLRSWSMMLWVKGGGLNVQLRTQTNNRWRTRRRDWCSAPTNNPCTYRSTWKHADVYEENGECHQ